MDQVTKVRKYLKQEQWSALISDCQSSGMTVTALTEPILIMRQDQFGASSEKTPRDAVDDQLSLFDEAEVCADASVLEPVT